MEVDMEVDMEAAMVEVAEAVAEVSEVNKEGAILVEEDFNQEVLLKVLHLGTMGDR